MTRLDSRSDRQLDGADATSSPRKVLFLLTHSAAGGAQEVWANLAESFDRRGHQVWLAALFPSSDSLREVSPRTPWTHVLPKKPRSLGGAVALLRALTRLIRTEQPDAIITALPAANVLAPIAVKLAGTKTKVITSHHSPTETHSRLLNLIDGLSSSLATVSTVVSVSNTVGRSHADKPPAYRAKQLTIMNALPPHIETEIARLSAQRPRDAARGRLVVATGRLAFQKNYPVLIRAMAHMPDVELHVIGAGPDEADLKALADSLGVEGRVRFLGFRPRSEALALMAEGDVFAQPSLFEGHSLGLVEAARLGLPLVVSDAPVQVEGVSLGDALCGLVAPVHDDRALAEAILSLLNDPATYRDYAARAARLGDSARWDAMLAAYERLVD